MRLHHLLITATTLFSIFTPTSAFWRLPCDKPISVQRADPIVQPGQIGSHVHTIMGASRFSATSTPETIRQSNCSTCKVVEDKSNYWIGQLYHQWENGSYTSVPQIGGMLVYYLQRQDPKDKEYPKIRAFPRGFQMIAGTPSRRTYDVSEKDSHGTFNNTALEERAVSYACLNYAQGSPETKAFPTVNCPQGLRTQVFFPSCWDGVNLDSVDHKSHVHYPDRVDNGICPPSHPVRIISIFYEVTFDINKFKDSWIGADGKPFRPFPFVWSTGDQYGASHHADFMDGWETDVLQKAVDECTDPSGVVEKCQHFHYSPDFGNKCMLETTPMTDEKVLGTFPMGTPLPGQKMTTPLTFSTYTTPYVGNGTIQGNTNYDDYYGTTTPPTNNGNGQGSTTNSPTTPPTNNVQGSTGITMNDATSVSVTNGLVTLLLATIAILQ